MLCIQHTLSYNLNIEIVLVLTLDLDFSVSKFTIKNGTKTLNICFGRVFVKWSAMVYLPAIWATRNCLCRTLSATQK